MYVVGGQKKKSDANYVDHRRNLFCNELAFLRLRLDGFFPDLEQPVSRSGYPLRT